MTLMPLVPGRCATGISKKVDMSKYQTLSEEQKVKIKVIPSHWVWGGVLGESAKCYERGTSLLLSPSVMCMQPLHVAAAALLLFEAANLVQALATQALRAANIELCAGRPGGKNEGGNATACPWRGHHRGGGGVHLYSRRPGGFTYTW